MSGEDEGAAEGPLFEPPQSRCTSLASVSSEGSTESHVVEQEEMEALTRDVRDLKEAIGRLHRAVHPQCLDLGSTRAISQERLSDLLRILRQMLEKYPLLQSNELVESASYLIYLVKEFDFKDKDTSAFDEALDGLALSVRNRVTEYLSGDLDSNVSLSSSSKTKSCENLVPCSDASLLHPSSSSEEEGLSPEQIDALLMRHEQGVDHALFRAKLWSKYAKDVMTYIEKRTTYEMEFARNITKLAQTMRPVLKEESYLPFQSIYCTALDQDLEMCSRIQTTCRNLQSHKFIEPLTARRSEHERMRKLLKDRWYKELKKMHESVNNLRKAKTTYMQRTQEYERCREAVRIAEQGAEIGATGENKVDKRKRLEEEAYTKTVESECHYKNCVADANSKHRNLLFVKAEFLQQIRELILQCDQTMKAVTVSYFQLQHGLLSNIPVQFQTLCESARLYEPGTQFMEYVKRMPKPQAVRFSTPDPFSFEPYSEEQILLLDKQRKVSASLDPDSVVDGASSSLVGTYKMKSEQQRASRFSWTPPAQSNPEPSDTESVESRDSGRSQETSPSASPMIVGRIKTPSLPTISAAVTISSGSTIVPPGAPAIISSSEEIDFETDSHLSKPVQTSTVDGGSNNNINNNNNRRQFLSKAAQTHKFRKLKTFSKCRECDSFLFQGYECQECGLSSHKKCLETLAIQCGHKRLLRKMTTFGVDLAQHLLETGSQVPPLVCKCLHEIDERGILVKGIYRTSGVKSKVEKLCQSFENGAELVELTDVQPNVIANVLKLYMRQLPEPLLTSKLYPEFIRAAKSCPAKADETAINSDLRALISRLPRSHYLTLANLMHHLRRIASESDVNNMPASNLAIVFGPTLLRTSESGGADLSAVADAVHQARAVELLILNANYIFGSEEGIKPKDFLKYTSPPAPLTIRDHENKENTVESYFFRSYRRDTANDVFSSIKAGDSTDDGKDTLTQDNSVNDPNTNPILAAYLAGEATGNSDDDDADIPDFLLPDSTSYRMKKSPLLVRNSSPPKIIKQSLKNFSGLEGVTPGMLSTQDSLEVVQRLSKSSSATSSIDHSTVSPFNNVGSYSGSGVLVKQRSAILPLEVSTDSSSNAAPNTTTLCGSGRPLFAKVGKSAKKHSLDEDHLNSETLSHLQTESLDVPSTEENIKKVSPSTSSTSSSSSAAGCGGIILRSYQSPSSGRSSLLIGINSSPPLPSFGSGIVIPPSRSCSLSETDSHELLNVHRRKLQTLSNTTILNIEENKVKIQVPGCSSAANSSATPVTSNTTTTTTLPAPGLVTSLLSMPHTNTSTAHNDKGVDLH
ncbi:rho GTPase-activating protein 45 [Lepeophtheirus salmonis]|uniref:Minor histocompatibility protein HA1like [Metaseiulus occidentalis] n=1 Tax=Lepeophtheirus salmonis TaxID=72036 RepID=A0A0K2TQ62_LEPSM|nr:rho GTPase-activating protein 45-like [Lepeophtheirus salmonis]